MPCHVEQPRRARLGSGHCAGDLALQGDGAHGASTWNEARRVAGVAGLTHHDPRGSAITRLALADASLPEIAALTGIR